MGKIASLINKLHMLIYSINLGRLMINLYSLEFVLRTFLLMNDIGLEKTTTFTQSIYTMKIGQEVENNLFIKFDYLSELINEYNDLVSSLCSYPDELKIDNKIVRFRNTLVHGHVFYKEPSPPFTTMLLLKFNKPKRNKTTSKRKLILNEAMTNDWFNKNIKWIQDEYKKVVEACRRKNPKSIG